MSQMGGDVPILVIDSVTNGTYDIVIPILIAMVILATTNGCTKETKPQDWMRMGTV